MVEACLVCKRIKSFSRAEQQSQTGLRALNHVFVLNDYFKDCANNHYHHTTKLDQHYDKTTQQNICNSQRILLLWTVCA